MKTKNLIGATSIIIATFATPFCGALTIINKASVNETQSVKIIFSSEGHTIERCLSYQRQFEVPQDVESFTIDDYANTSCRGAPLNSDKGKIEIMRNRNNGFFHNLFNRKENKKDALLPDKNYNYHGGSVVTSFTER